MGALNFPSRTRYPQNIAVSGLRTEYRMFIEFRRKQHTFAPRLGKSLSQVFTVEADDSAEAIELDNPEICDTDFSLIGRAEE